MVVFAGGRKRSAEHQRAQGGHAEAVEADGDPDDDSAATSGWTVLRIGSGVRLGGEALEDVLGDPAHLVCGPRGQDTEWGPRGRGSKPGVTAIIQVANIQFGER